MLRSYKELKVWQKAYELCLNIYKVTKRFSKDEMYGLTSQIRRFVMSVRSNVGSKGQIVGFDFHDRVVRFLGF